jgi:hypothetical protein
MVLAIADVRRPLGRHSRGTISLSEIGRTMLEAAAMLYASATKTVTKVVPPGSVVTASEAGELAKFVGKMFEQGPVERVAMVFIGGRADAERALPELKRFGVRCLAIVDGVEEELYQGQRVVPTDDEVFKQGTLLPILREASWPHIDEVVHRRLVGGNAAELGPWVTFGWDNPKAVARFTTADLGTRTIADVEAEALANLAKQAFEPRVIKPRVIGLPGEYCSEALLVPDVMKTCARVIGSELLCVAVPQESRLVAVPGDDPQLVGGLLAWTREIFDGSKGRRISPLPFLVSDGRVVGFASASGPEATPTKKAWYKFW